MKKVFVTTSWDDGHVLDMKLAALLQKYNLKGTFYISPLNQHITPEDRLTSDQVLELAKNFEIGAHTMTHPDLLKLSYTDAEKEVVDSKLHLEKIIGKSVTAFCYPSGRYGDQHVSMVKRLGFHVARTVRRFSFGISKDSFQMETSVHVYNHWSDLFDILVFSRFNPINFLRYYRHWDELAIAMFEKVLKDGGVFHIWGHSWEIDRNNDWKRLERVFRYISGRNDVFYISNKEVV